MSDFSLILEAVLNLFRDRLRPMLKQIQYCLSPIFKTLLIKIEIQAK